MRKSKLFGLVGAGVVLVSSLSIYVVTAAVPDAASVINSIRGSGSDGAAQSPRDEFSLAIDTMVQARADAAPDVQARQWLDLYLKYEPTMNSERFQHLVSSIPGPDAWPALAQQVAQLPAAEKAETKKQRTLLALLPPLLTNDREAQVTALAALEEALKSPGVMVDPDMWGERFDVLRTFVGVKEANQESRALRRFRMQLSPNYRSDAIELPDLLATEDEAAVRELLGELLRRPMLISPSGSHATARLAVSMALEQIDELAAAQWGLVEHSDDVALYEALVAKFDKPVEPKPAAGESTGLMGSIVKMVRGRNDSSMMHDDWSSRRYRNEADMHYITLLLTAGREDDAYVALKKIIDTAGSEARERINLNSWVYRTANDRLLQQRQFTLLDRVLADEPTLQFWSVYVRLGTMTQQDEKMLTRIDAALAAEHLDSETRDELLETKIDGLLATSKVDEAVVMILQMLDADATAAQRKQELSLQLATLGLIRKNEAWLDRGLKELTGSGDELAESMDEYRRQSHAQEVISILVKAGRIDEAFERQAAVLEQIHRASTHPAHGYRSSDGYRDDLTTLAALYHKMGRHKDVLTLLDEAPWWGAPDLIQLSGRRYYGNNPELANIQYFAAAALADEKRIDEAVKILQYVINEEPGDDAAYELLVKVQGPEAEPFLRLAFKRDQFEERPLIWIGVLKLQQGRLDEAQQFLEQAISIDPSDGEQGKGDRMRVYAVMADVMEAKGDADKAKFFRDVVRAIRMSEDADDLHEAGLLREAVDLYLESVGVFADAYCIQSRLAIQLMELGLFDQAKEHYRRAFELMPDSFGRMESHCFGCEGAFSGTLAVSIAEEVFEQLAKQRPNDPKVHYLLGYLRSSQDRNTEAVKSFRRAVELDPDYINAWKSLIRYGSDGLLTSEEVDDVALNILRLDPLGRHTGRDFSRVHDLAAAWKAIEAANKLMPEPVTKLLPLTASAARGSEVGGDEAMMFEEDMMGMLGEATESSSPGRMIAESSIVAQLIQLHHMIDYSRMRY